MSINLEVPTGLVCPEGDIFTFPSKADLVNALNDIVSIPAKLKLQFLIIKQNKKRKSVTFGKNSTTLISQKKRKMKSSRK